MDGDRHVRAGRMLLDVGERLLGNPQNRLRLLRRSDAPRSPSIVSPHPASRLSCESRRRVPRSRAATAIRSPRSAPTGPACLPKALPGEVVCLADA